ncbi:MAG: hypothetical protein ACI835_005353, partial [Planctomycetota bacterium]
MNRKDPLGQRAHDLQRAVNRREFLRMGGASIGAIALQQQLFADSAQALTPAYHHAPRAKRVIQLFMAGAPSQFELFEYKKELQRHDGKTPPESLIRGKRFAFIDPRLSKLLGTKRAFAQHGDSGAWVSELMPFTSQIVDKLCFLRGVHTNEINHGPAKLFMNTGFGQFGRPSLGSWISYGIGSEAHDLPGFVVLQSGNRGPRGGAPLWGNGFLSPRFQGTPFRSGREPVLHLGNPEGVTGAEQGEFFDTVSDLNQHRNQSLQDEQVAARIAS